MTLPCFHCDKELESALPDGYGIDIYNQPYAGTAFIAQGHYGSTVWDCEPGWLEINICDDCLREKAKGGNKILHVINEPVRLEFKVESWVPYSKTDDIGNCEYTFSHTQSWCGNKNCRED